ncbi:hypothetical protein P152DRAFT_478785 [Eremomyces bilateralis CBS 781.70]|uniref:Ornithine decarboxylase antizyme n=1 Tax=Eremomyces bilateralis CBS 781.70 TaxID=1392243 RepID=A0A6G1GDU5_9PEZI|nr:uncharacterized protein P152DRAFT_478785 [Eremomyces bilateralis CBS 781.70]KAF1816213.1 hypothetical protein P152DRAFT_478785 [Eremomyces bilateralis CBS 781.70]
MSGSPVPLNFLASCYVVDGTPSPPRSPLLAARHDSGVVVHSAAKHAAHAELTNGRHASDGRNRAGGAAAAYTIAEECERLFCGTLQAVFLGEGNNVKQDSLAMGVPYTSVCAVSSSVDTTSSLMTTSSSGMAMETSRSYSLSTGSDFSEEGSPALSSVRADRAFMEHGQVRQWVEMWDYSGGLQFRGFVVGDGDQRALFVFFDDGVVGTDLKPGLMALLELCDQPAISCLRLNVCLDRTADPASMKHLMRDLGWVGFEPTTLVDWTHSDDIISDRWVFLGIDV